MRTGVAAILLAALMPLGAMASTVFCADQKGGAIAVVDLRTGQTRSVPVAISPHNVEACGPNRIFAVGSDAAMSDDMPDMPMPGKLVEIDAQTLAVTRSAFLGMHPAHVVCDRAAKRAFVTLADEDAVAIVDVQTFRVVGRVSVGKHPHGLRLSADGSRLFVANSIGKSVSIVDTDSLKELAEVPVPGSPVQVAPNPDGRSVYATLSDNDEVVAVDLRTRRVTARVEVGRNPAQLTITADGRWLVVANQGTSERPDDRVAIIDTRTLSMTGWVKVAAGPHGVAIDPSGQRAYVTSPYAGTISVIDIEGRRLVTAYPAGSDPNGVTLLP